MNLAQHFTGSLPLPGIGRPGTVVRPGPSEQALLRFVAGIRALLAGLIGLLMLVDTSTFWQWHVATVLPYMVWAAFLLWATLHGWQRAAARLWLWIDVGVLLVASQFHAINLPLFGVFTVLPVVALAVLGGVVPALALALISAAATFVLGSANRAGDAAFAMQQIAPLVMLSVGAVSVMLARPSRELRQRLQLVETLGARSDPRHGLRRQVGVLLDQLGAHYGLSAATIGLQGPEPRVFQWQKGMSTCELDGLEAEQWVGCLAQLPRSKGCRCSFTGAAAPVVHAVETSTGAASSFAADDAWHAFAKFGAQVLTLPVVSYGQPLGTLCLYRAGAAFTTGDLLWLADVLHEAMPLLERADLLEQLQRETAARERERIGRDLHDSAIQPYLGLKYGLEALARQAGPASPISGQIADLVHMATDELQALREVIGGLRRGADPAAADDAPLAALERQAQRFQVLYGLQVRVVATDAPRLRGAMAKAVLLMVNEALTNVRRHTAASTVDVQLDVEFSDLVLRLRNDCGSMPASEKGFLPRSLTERASALGGGVTVLQEFDQTEIVIRLPLLGAVV